METLYVKLLKLAHQDTGLRKYLVPLLRKHAGGGTKGRNPMFDDPGPSIQNLTAFLRHFPGVSDNPGQFDHVEFLLPSGKTKYLMAMNAHDLLGRLVIHGEPGEGFNPFIGIQWMWTKTQHGWTILNPRLTYENETAWVLGH